MIARLGRVTYVSVENEVRRIDPDLRTFFNVNTTLDMDTAEKMLKEGIRQGVRNSGD